MIRNLLFLLFIAGIFNQVKAQSPSDPAIWENDIRKFEHLDSSERYAADALLFLGSSSIRLWDSIASDMAPYNVIQRGFGGSKLSDLVVFARRIVSPHPCRAIVMFVANDISGNDEDKRPEEVASLFSQVIDTIRQSHPQTPVFWIEITPTPSRWHVWEQASKANQLIKSRCSPEADTYYISTSQVFLDEGGRPKPEYFLPDMLHLNRKGYEVWSEIIKQEIKKRVDEICARRDKALPCLNYTH